MPSKKRNVTLGSRKSCQHVSIHHAESPDGQKGMTPDSRHPVRSIRLTPVKRESYCISLNREMMRSSLATTLSWRLC